MTFSPYDDGIDAPRETLAARALPKETRPGVPRWPVSAGAPVQIAITERTLPGEELTERSAAAQQAGWQHLSLLRKSLWAYGEERLSELLVDRGLKISSLSWIGGFTGSAGFTYREAIDDGRLAIQEAARLGADMLIVAPGSRGGHTFRHAQRVIVDGMRHLADLAGRRKIRLAMLTLPATGTPQRLSGIETLELAQQLLDMIASPCVGLSIPIDGWLGHATAIPALQALAPQVQQAVSHLPDTVCDAWKSGSAAAMRLLLQAGFRGSWEFDAGQVFPKSKQHCREASSLQAAAYYQDLLDNLTRESGLHVS